jgi:hypothetical protein
VITQVVSQKNCLQEKGDEDWDHLVCIPSFRLCTLPLEEVGRPKDSTDVVTKEKIPSL